MGNAPQSAGAAAGERLPQPGIFDPAYWVGAWLFGPRDFYEGLFSISIATAAGVAWLAGWPIRPDEPWPCYTGRKRFRPLAVAGITALLVGLNLTTYIPYRLGDMHGMYGVNRPPPRSRARQPPACPGAIYRARR